MKDTHCFLYKVYHSTFNHVYFVKILPSSSGDDHLLTVTVYLGRKDKSQINGTDFCPVILGFSIVLLNL